MIVKQCRSCHAWFESPLLSFVNYCAKPECQRMFRVIAADIKSTRSLCADVFNVWDTQYPLEKHCYPYERVCRVCGERLIKKNGDYAANSRHCKKHRGQSPVPELSSWGLCAAYFLDEVQKTQNDLLARIQTIFPFITDTRGFLFCQKCGNLSRCQEGTPFYIQNNDYYQYKQRWFKLPVINVHHLKPVHTLQINELSLIWDHKNLTAVCRACHGIYHRKKEITVPTEKWKTLSSWVTK